MENIRFHHSIINQSNGCITKSLEPEYNFSTGEREILVENILEFRGQLLSIGVPIADDYKLSIEKNKDTDSSIIIERTINCGVDGYRLIKDNPQKSKNILTQIVKGLLPILEQPEVCLVPDPHPANWCFDTEDRARYIDFQPPRFKGRDGIKLVGFPQPTGKEYSWSVGRYYSKAGLVRILRFNAMRAGGFSMRQLLLSIMRKELPSSLFTEIINELEDLLEERVNRKEISVSKALELCDVWSIDENGNLFQKGDLFFNSREELETAIEKYKGECVSFHCEDPEILEKNRNEN